MLDNERQQPDGIEESGENEEPLGAVGEVADGAEVVESGDSAADEGVGENGEAEEQAPRSQRRERGGGRAAREAEAALEPPTEPQPAHRLYEQLKKEIIPAMVREFNYGNPMVVPRLQKIVLNIGVGEALTNARDMALSIKPL